MNHRFFRVAGLFLGVAVAACSDPSGVSQKETPAATPASARPGVLDAAHEAYLNGDFIAMSERIRDVLLDPDSNELVKENAYALLDKAYESNKGNLPSRFKLPEGYQGVQYGALRGMTKNGPFYQVFSRGRARDASHLVGLTVKRLPDEVLLDKQTKKGDFDLRDDEAGYKDFVLQLKVPALPGDGVFTIRLELDDGTVSEGWFIGHNLEASACPEIKSPAPTATLADPNPLVTWVPFRTPQFAAFEHRTLVVGVSKADDEGNDWYFWTDKPGDLGAVRIGAHPGILEKKLDAGDYWLSVGAHELRNFGPIRVQRVASTVLPIHVVR